MGNNVPNKRDILKMVKNGEISSQEAFKILRDTKNPKEKLALSQEGQPQLILCQSQWEKSTPNKKMGEMEGHIILFSTNGQLGDSIKKATKNQVEVILVKPSGEFGDKGNGNYTINPAVEEDYIKLIDKLKAQLVKVDKIVFAWNNETTDVKAHMEKGIYSLFHMNRAMIQMKSKDPITLLYLHGTNQGEIKALDAAVGGFNKTINMENPKFILKTVEIQEDHQQWGQIIKDELSIKDGDLEVLYREGNRYTKQLKEMPVDSQGKKPVTFKEKGVYLITGGMGGIGGIFAKHLASTFKARLVLMGRSPVDDEKQQRIKELEGLGAEVLYVACNIADEKQLKNVVEEAKEKFGKINGIIHSAGVIKDAFLLNKEVTDLKEVLEPKIGGTLNLDLATKGEDLDLFIMFSSLSSVMGNAGQCDYAYGNSFIDYYGFIRAEGDTTGKSKTVVINWPYWEEGGMQIAHQQKKIMEEQMGLLGLPSEEGIRALEIACGGELTQYIIGYGIKDKMIKFLDGRIKRTLAPKVQESTKINRKTYNQKDNQVQKDSIVQKDVGVQRDPLMKKTEEYLKNVFSQALKIPISKIDSDTDFKDYGIDSIMVEQFNMKMEENFGTLSKTILFEYRNLKDLTEYFVEGYEGILVKLLGLEATEKKTSSTQQKEKRNSTKKKEAKQSPTRRGTSAWRTSKGNSNNDIGVAIVGLSGRYPGAKNLQEFWQNLKAGRDSITEIPETRWDWKKYFDENPAKMDEGKAYSKWGGFIEDVDKFDPLFFNISPKEAEVMDPQERIFLEAAWEALEDAGYTRTKLQQYSGCGMKGNVGVFAGVTSTLYQLIGSDEWHKGNRVMPNASQWTIANRVSYVLNLHGPSMPLDTACSSGLTALHIAVESIKKGECEMAIAGGVNLYLHPSKYIGMCKMHMLSPTGKCHTFGEASDGFVPGEGVGALILKPLDQAVKDGDYIYGVIKSSTLNHGGTTNGYTVPNPNAQAALIAEALKKGNINPRTISYIEAHGTGTKLGDPIEITGLTKAYREYTKDTQYCPIGSVKTNIGHLESAAGIAGLTKILLQMKYQQLVPSLHADVLNPNIDFDNSPFYVQKSLSQWERPQVMENGRRKQFPRRAAISSFGAGGGNAHVILEEYENQLSTQEDHQQQVFILSAKNSDRLRAYAEKLTDYLVDDSVNEGEVKEKVDLPQLKKKIEETLVKMATEVLDINSEEIAVTDDLYEYGFDAVDMARLTEGLNQLYDLDINSADFLTNISIAHLTEYLCREYHELISEGFKEKKQKNTIETEVTEKKASLVNIAYTLQMGREFLEERLAVLASSREELREKLLRYSKGEVDIEDLYTGNVRKGKGKSKFLVDEEEGQDFISKVVENRKLSILAQLWISGIDDLDWEGLYSGNNVTPRRVPLPTYPFARDRYWIPVMEEETTSNIRREKLHPFVGENISTLQQSMFSTRFYGNEFYILGDSITNEKMISNLTLLEILRATGEIASQRKIDKLAEIQWSKPYLPVSNGMELKTNVYPTADGLLMEVYEEDKAGNVKIYAQAKAHEGKGMTDGAVGMDLQNKILEMEEINPSTLNTQLKNTFGEDLLEKGHITKVWRGLNSQLVELNLSFKEEDEKVALHPYIVEALLVALRLEVGEAELMAYSVDSIEIHQSIGGTCYCLVNRRRDQEETVGDIVMMDAEGTVLMKLNQLRLKPQSQTTTFMTGDSEGIDSLYLTEKWIKKELPSNTSKEALKNMNLLVFSEDDQLHEGIQQQFKSLNSNIILTKWGSHFKEHHDHLYEINPKEPQDFNQLLKTLAEKNLLPNQILYIAKGGGLATEDDELWKQLDGGVYSLFHLSKALMHHKSIRKIQLYYVYSTENNESQPHNAAIAGFIKTVAIENPNFKFRSMEFNQTPENQISALILQEMALGEKADMMVRYNQIERYVKRLVEHTVKGETDEKLPLQEGGVYVITGGTGGLGFIFANYITQQVEGKLVLTGRSDLTESKKEKIKALEAQGMEVKYLKADISKKRDVEALINETRETFGKINGIFHSAGVIKDAFILKKTKEEMDQVISPKVMGAVHLDQATMKDSLDFFIMFSSMASIIGNVGQCDYAYGNAFLDHFSAYRKAMGRTGITMAINWPLWENGGMMISQQEKEMIMEQTGMLPMPTEVGLKALGVVASSQLAHCGISYGIREKALALLNWQKESKEEKIQDAKELVAATIDIDETLLIGKTELFLKEIFANIIKLPADKIDHEMSFQEYGIDSIMIEEFNGKMQQHFKGLSKTLLFEHRTLEELLEYFISQHRGELMEILGLSNKAKQETVTVSPNGEKFWRKLESFKGLKTKTTIISGNHQEEMGLQDEIAIIGISGQYPGAADVNEFWKNLEAGRDMITEIPAERWDYRKYFNSNQNKQSKGKMYCKWGGFINNVDKFDPLFFNISPREAEIMDPQERIFLQTAWSALEDSGYTPSKLKSLSKNKRSGEVGVFVGVTNYTYPLLAYRGWENSDMVTLNPSPWSITNRISYVFNFQGPSMPVDTACSSSLTAIHLACESLKRRECSVAIAGGVNLYLHPSKYVSMCQMKMVSPTGKCYTFGANADGFIPGEGVGAIILKPLQKALEDQDQIYGVIKATALNHGGITNGYTVPNPKAQAELVREALRKSNIDSRTISLIEAHGTGTKLGDPIEINGLTQAFRQDTEDKQYCAISSVKSNIGHGESAAGIAGLTKILLQMKHRKLVPSLNADELNPNINFSDSPFYVQRQLEDWQQPVIHDKVYPRRAGISSFGAGGANAHIIVEEFISEAKEKKVENLKPVAIVLSAKNKERLKVYAQRIVDFVNENRDQSLENIAYTLQVAREALEERLAFITTSKGEMVKQLKGYIEEEATEGIFTGNIRDLQSKVQSSTEKVADLLATGNQEKLIELWVNGGKVDWQQLYLLGKPQRISMPTYPFAQDRYWVSTMEEELQPQLPMEDGAEMMYFTPQWEAKPLESMDLDAIKGDVLILSSDMGLYENIKGSFTNRKVVMVKSGDGFKELQEEFFEINPSKPNEYALLLKHLRQKGIKINNILVMWNTPIEVDHKAIEKELDYGIYSIFHLSRGIMEEKIEGNIKLLYIYPTTGDEGLPHKGAISGFAKTIRYENPKFQYKVIELKDTPANNRGGKILKELCEEEGREAEIRYVKDERQVKVLKEYMPTSVSKDLPLRHQGVYLITGGAGGLGLIFAEHISKKVKPKLILTGRSEINSKTQEKIQKLQALGAEVLYLQADVGKRGDVQALIQRTVEKYGKIDGVIHSAGVIRDAFIIKKDVKDMEEVIAPKVLGTLYLDEATKTLDLDFFMMYSSTSAVMGNLGQCDYSFANSYMDQFSQLRRSRVETGLRKGRTISINWPLWQKGGMQIAKGEQEVIAKQTGLEAMPTHEGVKAWELALMADVPQFVVSYGNKKKAMALLSQKTINQQKVEEVEEIEEVKTTEVMEEVAAMKEVEVIEEESMEILQAKTEEYVRGIFAEILKLPAEKIDPLVTFQEYGIDSIMIEHFNNRIEEEFGSISKTLLYEYKTVRDLIQYFMDHQAPKLKKMFGIEKKVVVKTEAVAKPEKVVSPSITGEVVEDTNDHDIAIIGMSGRYPAADNLDEFWRNLAEGKDCITEIPKERWDYREFFDPDVENVKAGKMYSKWGGFINDADKFDPLFFNISPKEAEMMDPQERIFLETAWSALEDGGYTPQQLQEKSGVGTIANIGTYVGVTTYTYQLANEKNGIVDENVRPNATPWTIANRVSYVLDLQGPSMPVDTACSSSLSAIHLACESLRKKETSMSIVGGVNLYLHPSKYIGLCQMRMLSPTGKCHTFGSNSDGFVPGEGVGAILLKPLKKAMADGDHIYGVIKGTAINHGGATSGYTVPNPNAQANVILQALKDAKVDARSISYIEAHGTGTKLGDPIEITGLDKAFKEYTNENQYCAIGSIKTNIGHLESAAGIAGITKILLQMKYKKLVPSLNVENINRNINFEETPFYVQRKLEDWKPESTPRRAGISSFGSGGANAHIIIEEFIQDEGTNRGTNQERPHVVVLSAKYEDKLKEYAKQMRDYIQSCQDINLEELEYTLQMGRVAMESRLAMVVRDENELLEILNRYLAGDDKIENCFVGDVENTTNRYQVITIVEGTKLEDLASKAELVELAKLWIKGYQVQWRLLYRDRKIQKQSLPTYPFDRERYWVETIHDQTSSSLSNQAQKLHQLIDSNESTFEEQRFKKVLSPKDFFMRDHVVEGKMVLPGVAYGEMARKAAELSNPKGKVKSIKNIIWSTPIQLEEDSKEIFISLYPVDQGAAEFEVTTEGIDGDRRLHSQGKITFVEDAQQQQLYDEIIDIEGIKDKCSLKVEGEECYNLYKEKGLQYGPSFQPISVLWGSQQEALSLLKLPKELMEDFEGFVLHPALLDGGLQTVTGVIGNKEMTSDEIKLPFALDEIKVIRPLTHVVYVHAKVTTDIGNIEKGISKFDIKFVDEMGQVLIFIKNYSVRALHKNSALSYRETDEDLMDLINQIASGKLNADEADRIMGDING